MNSTKPDIIEVSQFESAQDASEDLQRKLQQLIAEAAEADPVAGLRRTRERAGERVQYLKTAHLHLNQKAKSAAASVRDAQARVDDLLIDEPESHAEVEEAIRELLQRDTAQRAFSRAALQVVERRLPKADILHFETQANEFFALAHELARMGHERIRRTAELMAQAAEHEGEIAFDSKKTIFGQLLAQSAEFERRAHECLRWADERRVHHERLLKEVDPAA